MGNERDGTPGRGFETLLRSQAKAAETQGESPPRNAQNPAASQPRRNCAAGESSESNPTCECGCPRGWHENSGPDDSFFGRCRRSLPCPCAFYRTSGAGVETVRDGDGADRDHARSAAAPLAPENAETFSVNEVAPRDGGGLVGANGAGGGQGGNGGGERLSAPHEKQPDDGDRNAHHGSPPAATVAAAALLAQQHAAQWAALPQAISSYLRAVLPGRLVSRDVHTCVSAAIVYAVEHARNLAAQHREDWFRFGGAS